MSASLTSEDLELIANYRSVLVLDDINSHMLDPQDGLSIMMCGDPDQHPEAYTYQVEDILKVGFSKRIHPPAPLGGALKLAENSPANRDTPGYDNCLMHDLKAVNKLKGIKTFALYVHAPCAIAAMFGLRFADIIRYAFDAKLRLKREIPEATVAVFCHIDRGEGNKKTYFVSRQKWMQYHISDVGLSLKSVFPDRVNVKGIRPITA